MKSSKRDCPDNKAKIEVLSRSLKDPTFQINHWQYRKLKKWKEKSSPTHLSVCEQMFSFTGYKQRNKVGWRNK